MAYARPPKRMHSITVHVAPPAKGVALPPVSGPRDRPLVVIDAGHGGHDPGAASRTRDAREKDVTLALALALRDRLLRGGRVRVALTRSDDRFLLLQERYDIARRLGGVLSAAHHGGMSFTDAGNTPKVADGLLSLNPKILSKLLMPAAFREETAQGRKTGTRQ